MAVRDVVQAAAGVGGDKLYVEDVFSTYLYTGGANTATTINNGIDLAGEGGLVWIKARGLADGTYPQDHSLIDTERGPTTALMSNTTSGNSAQEYSLGTNGTFNSNGFTIASTNNQVNNDDVTVGYASWSFRKAPKFFDVVTWTGDGTTGRAIAHNLGSTPGCIIIKRTSLADGWYVHHRYDYTKYGFLQSTNAFQSTNSGVYFGSTAPDANNFYLGAGGNGNNSSGQTYVAYVFAHDAGGFGDDGEQNIISCGSFTTDGSANATVNLGWEPQFVIAKRSSNTGAWCIQDNMRGFTAKPTSYSSNPILFANSSDQEITGGANTLQMTSTGFTTDNVSYNANSTYIYIAIRRPMKTPESGTEVFVPLATRSSGIDQANPMFNAGWPVDLLIQGFKAGSTNAQMFMPRLTNNLLRSSNTDAETNGAGAYSFTGMLGVISPSGSDNTNADICGWNFRRAPGFFDIVAYTGTGSVQTVTHNLGVAPEFLIVKSRSLNGQEWPVQVNGDGTKILKLNSTSASITNSAYWNDTGATSTVFTVTGSGLTGSNNATYIAYLFATLAGVSKVGSYTGTAANLNVDCGFSSGARFVLIKRTDSTGDWYVWDSARGIVSGNDPYLLLNSTAAENTSTDYIDPLSSGFTVTSSAPAALNASGGNYIFLAIA